LRDDLRMPLIKLLLAPLLWLLRLLLALVILFEEWGWEPLQRAMAWLGRLPLLRQLEAALRRLPPHAALAALVLPSLLLLPVKLAALWLIGKGQAMLGLGLIIAAKIGSTALVARLFALLQPALLRLAWFAVLYARWTAWKAALLEWVRASAVWRGTRVLKRQLRRWWRRHAAGT
jgi:hypothetical protein